MNNLISIIIPAYNRESTIVRAVDSVLNQTYNNIEVVVVDDCSTDKTKEMVLSIGDPRVTYHRLDRNSGACVARNTGVSMSNGSIVAFQDSDDFWHKTKLERQIAYMENGNYDFITCGFYRVVGSEHFATGIKECPNDPVQLWCELLNNNWVSTQTIVCKKKCFDRIAFDPKIRRYQDWDLALQAANYFRIKRDSIKTLFFTDNSLCGNPVVI